MIKHVKYSEIDKGAWDKALSDHKNGNVFFSSWYLDAVCDSWDALIEDDYKTIMPLPLVRKMRVNMVYQPFFSRQLGLCGSNVDINEFLSIVPDSIKHLSIAFGNDINVELGEVGEANYQTLQLDDLDWVRSKYNSNAKRNIKKAIKNEVSIDFNVDHEEVVDLFKNIKKDGLKRLSDKDYAHLDRLMSGAEKNNAGITIGARKDGKIIAACFFLKFEKTIIYLKGAADEVGKTNGAMHFVFDKAIENFIANYDVLDFGGSNVKSVARFYKNFGAVDKSYKILNIDKLPMVLSALKKLKNKFYK
ncbi:MAG: GNAT family N-acetyltransferase [Flavobacteriales bacterium]|nr:GNAT family N-acetyltransferase [Flavobacteriales bacterium]